MMSAQAFPGIPDSARLRYRLMDERDAPLWFELDQDPEVMRFLNDGKPTTWEDLERHLVPRTTAFTDRAKGLGLWEVREKESGEYLGWVLVRHYRFDSPLREDDNLELGWRLKRHCWGRGIATEAAGTLIEVFRRDPAIRVFSALADPANLASIGVMKKLGMRYIDARVHHTPMRDYTCVYYERPARLPSV